MEPVKFEAPHAILSRGVGKSVLDDLYISHFRFMPGGLNWASSLIAAAGW